MSVHSDLVRDLVAALAGPTAPVEDPEAPAAEGPFDVPIGQWLSYRGATQALDEPSTSWEALGATWDGDVWEWLSGGLLDAWAGPSALRNGSYVVAVNAMSDAFEVFETETAARRFVADLRALAVG